MSNRENRALLPPTDKSCNDNPEDCNELCKRVLQPFMIERPELLESLDIPDPDENWNFNNYNLAEYYSKFLEPIAQYVKIEEGIENEKRGRKDILRVNYVKILNIIFGKVDKIVPFWCLPQKFSELNHLDRLQITLLFILEYSRNNLDQIKNSERFNSYLQNMMAPYWAMVGKVVFMEQTNRYQFLSQNIGDLYNYLNSGGETPDLTHIKAGLQSFSTRYEITRIDTAYHVMFTYWGTNPIYNRAFLIDEKYRRAMVTNGGIFGYKKCGKDNTAELNNEAAGSTQGGDSPKIDHFFIYDFNDVREKDDQRDPEAIKDLLNSITNLVEIINNPGEEVIIPKPFNPSIKTETIKVPILTTLSFWGGCGMKIPKNAGITVGFEKVFPAVYIKTDSGRDSIIVQEYAWQTSMVIQNKNTVMINGENFNEITVEANNFHHKYGRECLIPINPDNQLSYGKAEKNSEITKPPLKSESSSKSMKKALGVSTTFKGSQQHSVVFEISSQKFNQLMDSKFLSKDSPLEKSEKEKLLKYFRKLDIRVLKEFEKCEVVVQLPYVTPQSDSLTSVSFGLLKNGSPGEDEYEAEEEIVLSCS